MIFKKYLVWLGWGFVAVCRLLVVVASLGEHWLWGTQASVLVRHGLSSCGSWALERGLSS